MPVEHDQASLRRGLFICQRRADVVNFVPDVFTA